MSDRPQSLQLGGLVGGKYRLLKKIGEGGHGRVYRAVNTLLGREVAIKVLKPEFVRDETAKKRFFREAKTANRIRHPNVVDVLDVGDSDEGPWMVQELLVGESLSALIAREGSLAIPKALELLMPALSALALAHSKGIAHRDFKPENVFLVRTEDGTIKPKILDFGLSKASIQFGSVRDSDRVTGTGVVVGTPAYLAPERVRMESEGDVAGDVWAIGVVLYECTTGFLPFPARTVREMFMQISSGAATPIEDVSPEIDEDFAKIVMRCLRKEPERRYPSAAEIEEDLRRYLDGKKPDVTQRHAAVQAPPEPIERSSAPPSDVKVARSVDESAQVLAVTQSEREPAPSVPPSDRQAPGAARVSEPRATSAAATRTGDEDPRVRNEDEPTQSTRALMALLAVVVLALVAALWYASQRSPSAVERTQREPSSTDGRGDATNSSASIEDGASALSAEPPREEAETDSATHERDERAREDGRAPIAVRVSPRSTETGSSQRSRDAAATSPSPTVIQLRENR